MKLDSEPRVATKNKLYWKKYVHAEMQATINARAPRYDENLFQYQNDSTNVLALLSLIFIPLNAFVFNTSFALFSMNFFDLSAISPIRSIAIFPWC